MQIKIPPTPLFFCSTISFATKKHKIRPSKKHRVGEGWWFRGDISSRARLEFHWHVTSSFCQEGVSFIQLYHLTGKLTFGNGYGGDIKMRSPFHICPSCLFFYYYMRLPCSITYNHVYVTGYGLAFHHRCIVSRGSPTRVPLRPASSVFIAY